MRISDWSSDVCSSDLHLRVLLLIATLSPLVALVNTILGDALAHLHVLLRASLVVGLVVPAASYIILPLLTALASSMTQRRLPAATSTPLPESTRATCRSNPAQSAKSTVQTGRTSCEDRVWTYVERTMAAV